MARARATLRSITTCRVPAESRQRSSGGCTCGTAIADSAPTSTTAISTSSSVRPRSAMRAEVGGGRQAVNRVGASIDDL